MFNVWSKCPPVAMAWPSMYGFQATFQCINACYCRCRWGALLCYRSHHPVDETEVHANFIWHVEAHRCWKACAQRVLQCESQVWMYYGMWRAVSSGRELVTSCIGSLHVVGSSTMGCKGSCGWRSSQPNRTSFSCNEYLPSEQEVDLCTPWPNFFPTYTCLPSQLLLKFFIPHLTSTRDQQPPSTSKCSSF